MNTVAAASNQDEIDARRQTAAASHEEIWRAIKERRIGEAKDEMERHIDYNLQMMATYEERTRRGPLSEEELNYSTR